MGETNLMEKETIKLDLRKRQLHLLARTVLNALYDIHAKWQDVSSMIEKEKDSNSETAS